MITTSQYGSAWFATPFQAGTATTAATTFARFIFKTINKGTSAKQFEKVRGVGFEPTDP